MNGEWNPWDFPEVTAAEAQKHLAFLESYPHLTANVETRSGRPFLVFRDAVTGVGMGGADLIAEADVEAVRAMVRGAA